MSRNNDGGPAFPAAEYETEHGDMVVTRSGHGGMPLRDWFAGQAISGILANPDISASSARCGVSTEEYRQDVARAAYAVADSMLAERAKAEGRS